MRILITNDDGSGAAQLLPFRSGNDHPCKDHSGAVSGEKDQKAEGGIPLISAGGAAKTGV